MGAVAVAGFDYGALAPEKAAAARASAERIRGRMQLAAESIIEVGRELIDQKKALGHGNFLPWIEAEFGMSSDTAQNLMRISGEYGSNAEHVRHLSYRALIALSAPSTPHAVREEVIDRASKGEKVTAREVEALKAKVKKSEETLAEKEAQRAAQEARAAIAAKQARDAENRAMFAEADKERLTEELATLKEEVGRLKEDGIIHVLPAAAPPPGNAGWDEMGPAKVQAMKSAHEIIRQSMEVLTKLLDDTHPVFAQEYIDWGGQALAERLNYLSGRIS